MKKIMSVVLCLAIAIPVMCGAESFDLSNMSQEELLALITAAQTQLEKDEPAMVNSAIQLLKDKWQETYQNNPVRTESGYFEIAHTQIVYIDPEIATSELIGNGKNNLFHNIYCIVDFVLLVDYKVFPYHASAEGYGGENTVIVYLDGTMEASRSLFHQGFQRFILNEQYHYIASISDLGSEYNEITNLLEMP